ncbi:MAG: DUF1223 domain-containing protein [Williamsia sp.]|nr:DUF1223 domain-containing protein [Williamsia sp.]
MKITWSWLPLFFLLPAALVLFGKQKTPSKDARTGFAVVELFTSEGCSSCPAADQLVEKIAAENGGKRVYIASYHVDYWDRLGWKDRFSKKEYAAYQYAYAKQFKLNSVYTPQIVINGQLQFVGSNGILLRSSINNNLNQPETAQLTLQRAESDPAVCKVQYALEGGETSAALLFVLLQKKAVVRIERGENQGKTLSHTNIVRAVKSLTSGQLSGTLSIPVPADMRGEWELLCYAKDPAGKILTAQSIQAEPVK